SRIKESVRRWFKTPEPNKPMILENDRPELAVGVGASYYGLVKQGIGVRVGSGSPRSYYLGISTEKSVGQSAVCLVERGLDEGSVIDLPDMPLEVRTNQPVSFDVFSSSYRSGDTAGDIIAVDETLSVMAPIQTIIKFGKTGDKKQIPITMGAEYTEMGSLAMFCRSAVSDHHWKLQFQLRNSVAEPGTSETEVYDDALIEKACNTIEKVFSKEGNSDDLKKIVKSLERLVEQRKANWPLSFLRRMADKLIQIAPSREASAAHESRWLNLTGFCMRPGFGDAFDEERARKLWKIYLSGLKHDKAQQNRMDWWIFIRRIAAGLKAGQQRQFFQDTSALLIKPGKTKMAPQELVELWMTSGNMERLLVKDKVVLAKALMPQIKPGKNMDRFFWTLSRLGGRELLYGSVDRVIPPTEVSRWIQQVMKKPWKKNDPVDTLIASLSRKTGDRTRDIAEDLVDQIIAWLKEKGADQKTVVQIQKKTGMDMKEKSQQFGERLPTGLLLKQN
ncbi:MAG: molecular chaperone DnaK, partial [Desulfobacterales bacterium]|nr:molecular chaperone DnaK [Desulfobacterales bacterium]